MRLIKRAFGELDYLRYTKKAPRTTNQALHQLSTILTLYIQLGAPLSTHVFGALRAAWLGRFVRRLRYSRALEGCFCEVAGNDFVRL